MKPFLLSVYYKVAYHYLGWYREKIITSRGLVVIFDLKAHYEGLKADKENILISELQEDISKLKDEETILVNRVNKFQRNVDYETSELMLQLIKLKKSLNPDELNIEDLKEHYEGIKNGQEPKQEPTKKIDRSKEAKNLKNLYRELVKIYHPDKAPEGKEAEYSEIFKIITIFREQGDYEGMQSFSRTLKRDIKKGQPLYLENLIELKKELTKKLNLLIHDKKSFKGSLLYVELQDYERNPYTYISKQKDRIQSSIRNLENEINRTDLCSV